MRRSGWGSENAEERPEKQAGAQRGWGGQGVGVPQRRACRGEGGNLDQAPAGRLGRGHRGRGPRCSPGGEAVVTSRSPGCFLRNQARGLAGGRGG